MDIEGRRFEHFKYCTVNIYVVLEPPCILFYPFLIPLCFPLFSLFHYFIVSHVKFYPLLTSILLYSVPFYAAPSVMHFHTTIFIFHCNLVALYFIIYSTTLTPHHSFFLHFFIIPFLFLFHTFFLI